MTDLIERLESATGPDKGLDIMIAQAIGLRTWHGVTGGYSAALDYTASIDAALTLVPEGMWAEGTLLKSAYIEVHDNEHYAPMGVGRGAPPAIALCIAALKARAAVVAKDRS